MTEDEIIAGITIRDVKEDVLYHIIKTNIPLTFYSFAAFQVNKGDVSMAVMPNSQAQFMELVAEPCAFMGKGVGQAIRKFAEKQVKECRRSGHNWEHFAAGMWQSRLCYRCGTTQRSPADW